MDAAVPTVNVLVVFTGDAVPRLGFFAETFNSLKKNQIRLIPTLGK